MYLMLIITYIIILPRVYIISFFEDRNIDDVDFSIITVGFTLPPSSVKTNKYTINDIYHLKLN